MPENESEHLPMEVEPPEEEGRNWRDVAERWKSVGKQVKDLGERLALAFREGWEDEPLGERETQGLADQLRALGDRMDRAVDAVRDEARQPEVRARAKQTVESTRDASTELLEELQETLNEGLEDLNRRVDDLVRKRERQKRKD